MFHETLEEITEECFEPVQHLSPMPSFLVNTSEACNGAHKSARVSTLRSHAAPGVAEMLRPEGGFHIVQGTAPRKREPDKDPARRAYKVAHARALDIANIKARLLAGERLKPRQRRVATRWLEAAKELGIDLGRAA
jgi:hypothetical protein